MSWSTPDHLLIGPENLNEGDFSLLANPAFTAFRSKILTPKQVGLEGEKWAGPGVLKAIKNQFNVNYKLTQVYKLIEKMGLSFQKGTGITDPDNNVIY